MAANPAEGGVAVHDRHDDVEHDDVGQPVVEQRECGRAQKKMYRFHRMLPQDGSPAPALLFL